MHRLDWSEQCFMSPPTQELWNFRSQVLSLLVHRWNFRSLKLSLPYQYKKRITVAPSTKECSSHPTNIALQSVLASRHVHLTYDAGWHGIGKDYEVVIERIDKLQL